MSQQKDQFYKRHQHLNLDKSELERKWRVMREQEELQKLMEAAAAASKSSSNTVNSGGGGPAFSVSVGGSVIANALVVIGWPEGSTYENERGEIVSLDTVPTAVAFTDSKGNANFGVYDQRWIITDYSSGEPVKKYAPVSTYGGTADDYDASPMLSNISVKYVNPLTTILTGTDQLVGHQDFSKYEDWDFAKQMVEELMDVTVTPSEFEEIKEGKSVPRVYEPWVTPLKKARVLLEVMTQENDPIELEGDSTIINVKRTSLATETILSDTDINAYVKNRRSDSVPATTLKDLVLDSGVCPLCFSSNLLPKWNIGNADFVVDTVTAMFDKNADSTTFEDIYTTYSDDLTDNGEPVDPRPISSLLVITAANVANGVMDFYIVGDTLMNPTVGLFAYFASKDSLSKPTQVYFDEANVTGLGSEVISTKTVNKYRLTPTAWPTAPKKSFAGAFLYISAATTNNRTQVSQQLVLSFGGLNFVTLIEGKSLPEVTITPDPKASRYYLQSAIGKIIATLDNQTPLTINKKDYWYGTTEDAIDLYVYYNGTNWVLDNDSDAKAYLADGPVASPDGTYLVVDGKTRDDYYTLVIPKA